MASKSTQKISNPAWAIKELEKVREMTSGWNRPQKLDVFSKGGSYITQALKKYPRKMWNFTTKKENWCIREVLWNLADQEANI